MTSNFRQKRYLPLSGVIVASFKTASGMGCPMASGQSFLKGNAAYHIPSFSETLQSWFVTVTVQCPPFRLYPGSCGFPVKADGFFW